MESLKSVLIYPVQFLRNLAAEFRYIRAQDHITEFRRVVNFCRFVLKLALPFILLLAAFVYFGGRRGLSVEQQCALELKRTDHCGAWVCDKSTDVCHVCLRHDNVQNRFAHFNNPVLVDTHGAVAEAVDPHLGCSSPISVALFPRITIVYRSNGHSVKMSLVDSQAWCMQWCFDGIAGNLSRWLCEADVHSVYKNHDEM